MNDLAFWRKQPELDVLIAAYLLAGEPLPEQLFHTVSTNSYPPKVIATIKLIERRTGAVVRVPFRSVSNNPYHREPRPPPTTISQEQFQSLESALGVSLETVGVPAANTSRTLLPAEREKLLRQIGALALLLADKAKLYKRGSKPNASQIANAIGEIVEAIPDAETRGLGSSEVRESIASGLDLLNGDLPRGK